MRVTRGGRPLRDLEAIGDGFGEIALLRDLPRTATVTALRESVVLILDREAFLGAVTGHPVVAAEAGRVVEARLGDRDASREPGSLRAGGVTRGRDRGDGRSAGPASRYEIRIISATSRTRIVAPA